MGIHSQGCRWTWSYPHPYDFPSTGPADRCRRSGSGGVRGELGQRAPGHGDREWSGGA